MSSRTTSNVLKLREIAAVAASAAQDLEDGKLWPGDLSKRTALIREALDRVSEEVSRCG